MQLMMRVQDVYTPMAEHLRHQEDQAIIREQHHLLIPEDIHREEHRLHLVQKELPPVDDLLVQEVTIAEVHQAPADLTTQVDLRQAAVDLTIRAGLRLTAADGLHQEDPRTAEVEAAAVALLVEAEVDAAAADKIR